MRPRGGLPILTIAVMFAVAAWGGDDEAKRDKPRTEDRTPSAKPQAFTAAELKYCVEGAGALAAKPGQPRDHVGGAQHELVVSWPDTKDSADIYFAPDDAAAQMAAREIGGDASQKSNVIVVPDSRHPPTADESLLIDDCIP